MIASAAARYNSPPAMRLFLAINLPEDVLDHLAELQTSLRGCVRGPAGWTSRPQLHVTVKFIGQADDAFAGALAASLAAGDLPPAFELRATALEVFPDRGPPRILAARFTPSTIEPLAALHRRLEDACANLHIPREARPFRPHATLARLRDPRRLPDSLPSATAAAFPGPSFRVASVDLMRSTLSHAGATYQCLRRFDLR